MRLPVAVLAGIATAASALAGDLSSVVLAGGSPRTVPVAIRREADYVAMPVTITSDQPDPATRLQEIRSTLASILSASSNYEDIVAFTGPVTLSTRGGAKLLSYASSSADAAEAQVHLLTPLRGTDKDIYTCGAELGAFLKAIRPTGKAECRPGTIVLAVANPEQDRDAILKSIADDVRARKEALGAVGAAAQLSGIEGPVLVRQATDREVELFIDYDLSVEIN